MNNTYSKVVLLKCSKYDTDLIENKLIEGFNLLGGLDKFISLNEKVILKPNWLALDSPDKHSITHPTVFEAVAKILKKYTSNIYYGDSPALHNYEVVANKCGYKSIADKLGLKLADFVNGKELIYENGAKIKKFFIAQGVIDCDSIISIPKLKTHGLEIITGAVKNQLGCIPGILKAELHVKLPDYVEFATMLVDLNLLLKPKLYIMDGIIAMEGNGPRSGKPRELNVILLSNDPVALDATVCRIINLDPEIVPTVVQGYKLGLGNYSKDKIILLGDSLEQFICPNFDVKRQPINTYKFNLLAHFKNLLPKPIIEKDKCIKCGECIKVCPVTPKAIIWQNKLPKHIYKYCIRCYCCQELCPKSAIKLKIPLIRKILDFLF